MPTTTTPRIEMIAHDLIEEGQYTRAASLLALAEERDRLRGLLRDALALLSDTEISGPRGPGEEPDQERGPKQKEY